MIARLLIANRGEIACRIIRTCRALDIATVAVFSDADRDALHVRDADESVSIGAAPARESYLNIEALLEAARSTGVDAIHPGYGFLSENAGFASACEKAGLVFVGPQPETIASMGNKDVAKSIMEKAGVPVVPGYHGDQQHDRELRKKARKIGLPLMIKACAGGGGKGMRIVRSKDEFADALAGARREAASSFGDDRVLLEKYLENPRHIEVQIFADQHGNAVHLFERECSIQRRYQKIIEEAPCPSITDDVRQRMAEAAIQAARAVNYCNAGTVEFILDTHGDFFFMEMNTRLQVEHPVTEMITGIDLVEWQLKVAAGEKLPLQQDEIRCHGHAIEARIYAENPYRDFLPTTGIVETFALPYAGHGMRIDSGIQQGDEIGIHYDPLLAKLIVHDESRRAATKKMQACLAQTALLGVGNNLALLRGIVDSTAFAGAAMDTGYLDRQLSAVLGDELTTPEVMAVAAICRIRNRMTHSRMSPAITIGEDNSPWHTKDSWRLAGPARSSFRFVTADGVESKISVVPGEDDEKTFQACCDGKNFSVTAGELATRDSRSEAGSDWTIDEKEFAVVTVQSDPWYQVSLNGSCYELQRLNLYASARTGEDEDAHPGSPLPGKIVSLLVSEGDRVESGDKLLVLEGMKMEYTLLARATGTVEKILFQTGDIVEAEVALVDILPDKAGR
jgi:3-methylcrotonyl-CoA carboxylase alpha subunit